MVASRGYDAIGTSQVLAAGFIVCRFDLDKKFSEVVVGCLAFVNNNLSHSTDDHT